MQVQDLEIPGVKLVGPPPVFPDARGSFSEHWSRRVFEAAGIANDWVQDNLAWSKEAGTVRGLHFQSPPSAQAKLVSVLRGRVLDVVVDIRRGSPTYGRHVTAELSAENGLKMLAPRRASARACWRPRPPPAPVTMATRPSKRMVMGELQS